MKRTHEDREKGKLKEQMKKQIAETPEVRKNRFKDSAKK